MSDLEEWKMYDLEEWKKYALEEWKMYDLEEWKMFRRKDVSTKRMIAASCSEINGASPSRMKDVVFFWMNVWSLRKMPHVYKINA